jgi:hypothetical protein
MPGNSVSLQLSHIAIDVVGDPRVAYGYLLATAPRTPPTPLEISMMDWVMTWLAYIPDERFLVRKIVAHRMIWDPDKGRSVWSYRRLGEKVGASHVAVKMWDERGVEIIHRALNKNNSSQDKIGLYLRGWEGASLAYSDHRPTRAGHSSPQSSGLVNSHEGSSSRR